MCGSLVAAVCGSPARAPATRRWGADALPARLPFKGAAAGAIESLSRPPRAARPPWASRFRACSPCGALLWSARRDEGGGSRVSHRRRDREPAPLSVERRPRRRDPAVAGTPWPLGVALMSIRSVGDASTRRAASKDTGIEPNQRRQRDLEHRLVIPGERRHRPGGLRSDCGCPTTRTYQSVRAQTWPKLGGTHSASSTSTLCLRLVVARGRLGWRRCRGRRLGGGSFSRGWGPRAWTRERRAWSPGDRRMRVRGCWCLARLRPARPHRGCLPSVLHAASSSSSSPGFFFVAAKTSCRRADAGERRLAMLSPARRGGSSQQKAKTISITAAALALRFALVAVAALVDAYKPLGLRYTDVDYDVLKDGARYMAEGGSPFQRAAYRYSPLVSYPLLLDVTTGLPWPSSCSACLMFY